MTISKGTLLGSYEILEHIGSGGMGEVYRARDSKLNREVALKVLPEQFARDPERVARFRREAQLLASLNHPNIAAIYTFEESATSRFLVMEYVPGETLREQTKRGPTPVEEALTITKQIAEALEHAHEKPIIHRDLKPANVKVTPEGKVKVLDFGLAKAFAGAGQPVDQNDIPTGSRHDTLAGAILGTPAYMSPEQAAGKQADKRADIWALGCVLYELISGKRAFEGETVTEIIASVLKSEPDWTALPETTPPGIRVLRRRCLEKDAKRRFRDAADVQIQIEETQTASATTVSAAASAIPARTRGRQALAVGGVALALGILVGGFGMWNFRPTTASRPVVRFTVAPPPGLQFGQVAVLTDQLAVLSPEGSRLALVLRKGNINQLYIRSLDQAEAVPLPGTEGATNPFFSPDGEWIAFTANRELKKVSVEGSSPQVLTQVDWGGGTWGPDDTIIYTQDYSTGLWRVPASGGAPEKLTEPDASQGELGHWWPQLLPDGETVLYTVYSTPVERTHIALYSLETREQKVLVESGMFGRYLPTGHVVYARAETLLAAPFDTERLEMTGPPVPVLDDVAMDFPSGSAFVSFSADGTLAFLRASSLFGNRRLVRVDRNGNIRQIGDVQRHYQQPSLSPDGRRIAMAISERGAAADIWTYDLERGTFTRVTFGAGTEFFPVWTRDGRRLIFTSEQPQFDLHWKSADGTGAEEPLLSSSFDKLPSAVSPDGKTLIYFEGQPRDSK